MKKKYNLIYLTSYKLPNNRAHSVQILKMCKNFSNFFYTVLICRVNKKYFKKEKLFNFKNFYFYENKLIVFLQKFFILLMYEKNPYNLYYTRDVHFAMFAFLLSKNKIYLELHYPFVNKFSLSYYFMKFLFDKNRIKIIFISKELKKIYSSNFKFKNHIIAHDAADFRRKVQKKGRLKNIGYAGHLYNGRGINLIIKLAIRFPWLNFNIAGGDLKKLKYFKKYCKNISNIKFYGHLKQSLVNNFLLKNDLLIAPYEKSVLVSNNIDTSKFMSPLKIFEYMSCARPILASNHKVLKEVLTNNKNAILCNPNKIDEWIKAIIILKRSKLRLRLSNQVYNDFINKYTWDKRVQKIIQPKLF